MAAPVRGNDSERFAFGRNWRRFTALVDDERIAAAEASLREMLGVGDLAGKTFLDVGSGSGLFSLAAHRLGARVHSFDYDPESVACTAALRDEHVRDGFVLAKLRTVGAGHGCNEFVFHKGAATTAHPARRGARTSSGS